MIRRTLRSLPLSLLAFLPGRAAGQQPLSHIPFCVVDSAAQAFSDQVRFRVAGTDSASRVEQGRVGLAPAAMDQINLVVDDSICLLASAAYSREEASARRVPPPFPVAVVRAGERWLVRLPDAPRQGVLDPRTVVFDANFRRVGGFGVAP